MRDFEGGKMGKRNGDCSHNIRFLFLSVVLGLCLSLAFSACTLWKSGDSSVPKTNNKTKRKHVDRNKTKHKNGHTIVLEEVECIDNLVIQYPPTSKPTLPFWQKVGKWMMRILVLIGLIAAMWYYRRKIAKI